MNAARVLLVAACSLAAMACGGSKGDDEGALQARPRGPGNQELAVPRTADQKTAAKADEPYKSPFDEDTPTGAAAQPEEEKKEEEKEERDLGAELKSALGSPASCLKPREAENAPDRITISISAQLVGSGRVTRASVSGAQLEASEIDCVRRRVEAIRLGEVEDAPRGVSTSVELELKKPANP